MKKKSIAIAAIATGIGGPADSSMFRTPIGSTSNRYKPHQGKKEMKRRRKQLNDRGKQ